MPTASLAERVRRFDPAEHGLSPAHLQRNVPLAPLTTFRIGGPADLLYRAATPEDLAQAVLAARAAELPCFVLGLGANILIGDRGFRGLVVQNRANTADWTDDGGVTVGSGVIMSDAHPRRSATRLVWL